MDLDALTPAQRRARTELLDLGGERPSFPADLAAVLRDRLEDGIAPLAGDLGRGEVAVNKTRLADVMACERYQVEREQAGFDGWNPRIAHATVAHKALELSVFLGGEPTPLDLVDAAIDRYVDSPDDPTGIGGWLRDAPAVELAEVRAEAHERVARFVESFPAQDIAGGEDGIVVADFATDLESLPPHVLERAEQITAQIQDE